MEKGLGYFRELFGLTEPDIRTYSPLTLAYIEMQFMSWLSVLF